MSLKIVQGMYSSQIKNLPHPLLLLKKAAKFLLHEA